MCFAGKSRRGLMVKEEKSHGVKLKFRDQQLASMAFL